MMREKFVANAMEAFTYHLMWCAAATYSQKLAPEGLTATMLGIVGGLHYGVGRAAGSMFGGSLMAIFNARIAFRIMGIIAGVVALVYTLIYYIFLRKDEIKLFNKKSGFSADNENNVVSKDMEIIDIKTTAPIDGEPTAADPLTAEGGGAVAGNGVHLKPKERCDSDVSRISVISATLSLSHPI
ncbi:unnamed protein product [Oppiella nova]|uniref:Major facilitator superfamily associated domain-containing protein n=1 Tax=Oppiella nova TaxID=334625 RepID=A0A7R9LI07_9ACAR|nr:unnamed protein product [Oppiella nova]CAG2163443.1 unnamed protein product [Oppiella nova]